MLYRLKCSDFEDRAKKILLLDWKLCSNLKNGRSPYRRCKRVIQSVIKYIICIKYTSVCVYVLLKMKRIQQWSKEVSELKVQMPLDSCND